ncbi:MAG: glycosyltransferase family 2 protein, partial [Bacteroidota bacterium]
FIINAGNSDDNTNELLQSLNDPKIEIIHNVWDDSLREGGHVLALETDKAFQHIPDEYDWAIYIQADEVLHEDYHNNIRKAMLQYQDDNRVEGLLLKYIHFYGTYDYVADSRKWYRNEIRVVKNDKKVNSYKDAQGFRKEGRKLNVKPVDAYVFHYGWVKDPVHQKAKEKDFHKLWHNDEWVEKNIKEEDLFDYSKIDSIKRFTGKHPSVMLNRVKNKNWVVHLDPAKKRMSMKNILLQKIESLTGYRFFEYKNYRKL